MGRRRRTIIGVRHHEQHRLGPQEPGDVEERGHRLPVGPLRVIEEHHQAPAGSQMCGERLTDRRGKSPRTRGRLAPGGADAGQLSDDVREQSPGNRRIAGDPVDPDDRLTHPGEEIPHERGLADTRLSLDGHDPAAATAHRFSHLAQDN